jgi:hypothetical protein
MGIEAYYHYTSEVGKNGILNSGCINTSSVKDGDACCGNGVYLTKIPPGSGAERAGLGAQGYKYAVRVMLPDHQMKQCRKDVYMFPERVRLDMTN